MITLYSGTMGSGKSLHMARDIRFALLSRKKNVIANFPIDMDYLTKNGKLESGEFIYRDNEKMTVKFLVRYAMKNHTIGKENQTLLILDEAGVKFNSRLYNAPDRQAWIKFLIMSRKLGFNIIFGSQKDRLIDRQFRALIEYDVIHRKANNFQIIGLLLTLFRIPLFTAITMWYGTRDKCSSEIFTYRKRDGKIYDTMMIFDEEFYGQAIGELVDIDDEDSTASPEPTPPAPPEDREGLHQRKGSLSRAERTAQGSGKRRICHTTECKDCKAQEICKLAWKIFKY